MTPPLAVAHIGMTVTDLDRAVAWYESAFGFTLMSPPVEIRADEGHAGAVASDVFGPRLGGFRQAHLASANGVAVELFEFIDPPGKRPRESFDYRRTGISHVCFIASDPAGLAKRIVEIGGIQRTSRTWPIFAGEPYLTCFCEDPFGNVIELYSHSHERTYANREPRAA